MDDNQIVYIKSEVDSDLFECMNYNNEYSPDDGNVEVDAAYNARKRGRVVDENAGKPEARANKTVSNNEESFPRFVVLLVNTCLLLNCTGWK